MSIEVAAQTSVRSSQVEVTAAGDVIDVQGKYFLNSLQRWALRTQGLELLT
jgi:hypothetical protein